jgi:hypothetical protein
LALLAGVLLAASSLGGCASLVVAGGVVSSDGTEVKGRVGAVEIGVPPGRTPTRPAS